MIKLKNQKNHCEFESSMCNRHIKESSPEQRYELSPKQASSTTKASEFQKTGNKLNLRDLQSPTTQTARVSWLSPATDNYSQHKFDQKALTSRYNQRNEIDFS